MAQYEFDSMRWCRTMAKAHWQRNEYDISSTFRTVAEEIDALRARVVRLEEALKTISTLYWHDAPAPEEMREIARRALEEK